MVMVAFMAAATIGASAEASYRPPERIWGDYHAVSVSGAGAARLFDRPKEIGVGLSHGKRGQWIGWEANCNGFGARLRIGRKRFRLGSITASTVGCPNLWGRQDNWLESLFSAGPHWLLRRGLLVFRGNGRVLRLGTRSG
jgi:hypothetical protein